MAWNDGVLTLKPSTPAEISMPLVFQNFVFTRTSDRYLSLMKTS